MQEKNKEPNKIKYITKHNGKNVIFSFVSAIKVNPDEFNLPYDWLRISNYGAIWGPV